MSIEDALSDEVLRRVRAGEADLAVTVVRTPPRGLDTQPLATDEFCAVFPREHRFAAEKTFAWEQLRTEPFIAFDPASSIRAQVDAALHGSGRVVQARDIAAVAGLVAAGLGVSAVPGLVLSLIEFAGLAHRPLTGPQVRRKVAVVRDLRRPVAAGDAGLRAIDAAACAGMPLPGTRAGRGRRNR